MVSKMHSLATLSLLGLAAASCISSGDQNTINDLFQSGGAGTVVQLCPGTNFTVSGTISFTAENQEISTSGYPTDDTRATIQPASGTNVSMLLSGYGLSGLRVKNIQFDGQRPSLGLVPDGGATIELGQASTGIEITNIVSKNARAWSCLHLLQSGNANAPCTNVTISNNQIGPCGNSGTNSAGVSQWADGISFACQDSLIENNHVEGSTDGGIVLFGAPGTTVQGNIIISSATDLGFGAINMVDDVYDGSYAGVLVTNNTITGQKMFNIGIAIGSYAWSFNDDIILQGPATITNNVFSGNIPFAIGVNGWTGGLTITGNDVSNVNSPSSSYSDANTCSAATTSVWEQSAHLVYYAPDITGTYDLQSDFFAATENATNFLCPTTPLPSSISYSLDELDVPINTVLAELHDNIITQYQGDNNIVTYNTTNGDYVPVWSSGHTSDVCGSDSSACSCQFQEDGNFVSVVSGEVQFSSGTSNVGHTLTFLNQSPWVEITNSAGTVVWSGSSSN